MATALENYMDLDTWLSDLEDLGVFSETVLADELELTRKVDVLSSSVSTYRQSNPTNYNQAAANIAATVTDATDAIDQANKVAFATTPAHHDRVIEVLEAAEAAAQRSAFNRFRRRGESLLDILRPVFNDIAQTITDTSSRIPAGVLNLEDATRLGLSAEYMQLESELQRWGDIADLLTDWIREGIIGKDRPGGVSLDYMVTNRDAYFKTLAGSSTVLRRVRAIVAGNPTMLTTEQITSQPIDRAAPPTLAQQNKANWEANEADKTAREELGLPTR